MKAFRITDKTNNDSIIGLGSYEDAIEMAADRLASASLPIWWKNSWLEKEEIIKILIEAGDLGLDEVTLQ